jgi:hypothetical protein
MTTFHSDVMKTDEGARPDLSAGHRPSFIESPGGVAQFKSGASTATFSAVISVDMGMQIR